MRKHEAIDLLKLYSLGDFKQWNAILRDCVEKRDINRLAKIRYQIQAGMDDLAKARLNSADICDTYCRWIRSIETTAKQIIKKQHPLPHDDPLIAKNFQKSIEVKRTRDRELMNFLNRSAY